MALRSLSTGKQYKNAYTILEKVKKGEIQSQYKAQDGGLFGKLNFYKKADLIKPHLHYIDESRLSTIVDSFVKDTSKISEFYQRMSKRAAFQAIDPDKKPDANAFHKKVNETYNKFPKHLKNDIFKMYYHKMNKLEFEERTDANYTKYKFIESSNNPVGKIMTESSNLKSSIFTRNVLAYYIMQLTAMEYIDPNAAKDIMDGLQGDSGFNSSGIDQALSKAFGNKQAEKDLDKAIQDAQNTCKSMDDTISDDIQEEMFKNIKENGGVNPGKLGPEYLEQVAANISRITLSLGSLKEKIKKLMDKSTNYFSARKETIHEDLFNSDNLGGLDEYIFLHPQLRKFMIEDVMIKDTKSVGKIDIYIDISGSMNSDCGIRDKHGNRIDKLDFCKAFAVKLQELGMLNKIYVFNDRVRELKSDIFSIASLSTSGGTNIDTAVEKIITNGVNALVITDAEDNCRTYTDKAFFIGVQGARFSSFDNKVIKEYSEKGQVIVFNGQTIQKVNTKGQIDTTN
jgi:hypothetical protein